MVNGFRKVRSVLQGIVLKFFDIDLESAEDKIRKEEKMRDKLGGKEIDVAQAKLDIKNLEKKAKISKVQY